MKILSRYVLREFLIPFLYCMTGFVMIYVLFDLFGSFSRMASAKIPMMSAVAYFCGYLAPYFHYIVPAALMLATLYTLWVFCRHSELIAMRASGISLVAIVRPIIAVSVLMAAVVFAVSEFYVPFRSPWAALMKSYQFDMARCARGKDIVYRNTLESRTWHVEELSNDGGVHLSGVRVTVDRPNGGARLMNVEAERADYLDGEWWFAKPRFQHYNELGQEIKSPTPERDALDVLNFPELRERPSDFLLQNRPWKFNSIRDRLRYLRTHSELDAARRRDYWYDVWAQIAAPLACIVITLLTIPAGIASGRQSVFRGVLGAIGQYFAFYALTIILMILAKNGWFPVIPAVFLPAVVFLALGICNFRSQR